MGGPPLLGNVERCKKGKPVTCRIAGCDVEVTSRYYKRFQVCPLHLRADAILENGILKRFCQQHNKFHPVGEFQDKNRSCRESLLRKKQKSLRDSRSRASQSDSAGNTNSTHNSSSEGSSHGCDHSDFCRQGGFLDDDSIVAPMHAQDLVAAGCLSKLPNSPTPTPISPISIDRMPGESSKDGYIMEPSNSSGELDAPSDDSGDLRPWEIFVPPISAQHVNPCQMDISPNVDTTTSSSLDMMPAMNWSAMALGETRQTPLPGQQQLGCVPTPHRIGEAVGINYDPYGHSSSAYQQTGDLLNIGLKDHDFEEVSYGHRQYMHDNFMPLNVPHCRNPFAQANYNKQLNLQQLRLGAMRGSYKTAVNTLSEGIPSLPRIGSHANWMTMKLSGVDPSAVPEDILMLVSQRIQNQMIHGSLAREGCVALHFDLIDMNRGATSPVASIDDEADVLGLSLVTDPILQRVVTYICSEDSPSCLAGAISLQTRTQLVHVNSRQITLVLSMERGEEIVPILQNPVPVCVGYEGGLVDVKCLIPDGKSPTFFCRVGDSMIKCNNAMQTESEDIAFDGGSKLGSLFHSESRNGEKDFTSSSCGSPLTTQTTESCTTVPQCSSARVVHLECECSTSMSAPLPIFVVTSDLEGLAAELETLNAQLLAHKLPLCQIEGLQREIGWSLESAHSCPLRPQQTWEGGNVTVSHIKPFSHRGEQEYENAIADITLQNIALVCRLGLPKLVNLLISSWANSEDQMCRLRDWRSTDGWSLLHLAALSGSPDMMSVVYNITRITPSSQPLWSWDIRGPGGITPVHFAALHLANNQFLPSQMPEFQQGFWSVFHTVKADDSVTPAQFLELQSLPNFNDHPLVSQPVRMKHSIGAVIGDIPLDIADTVHDKCTVGCSELKELSSPKQQQWRKQRGQPVQDAAADNCLVACSKLYLEDALPVPVLDNQNHGCDRINFALPQTAADSAQTKRYFSAASVKQQRSFAAALIICCCLLSSSNLNVAMSSTSAHQFCIALAATVTMHGLFHEERGKDLATFSSFKLQIIYFLLHLILAVVEIKGLVSSIVESNHSGQTQDPVKMVSPPAVCVPIGM